MKQIDKMPEFLAALVFLPLGFILGFMLHIFFLDTFLNEFFMEHKFWPSIVAGVVALCVGAFQVALKLYYKKYLFEHFYLVAIGLVMVSVGGFFLLLDGKCSHIFPELYFKTSSVITDFL